MMATGSRGISTIGRITQLTSRQIAEWRRSGIDKYPFSGIGFDSNTILFWFNHRRFERRKKERKNHKHEDLAIISFRIRISLLGHANHSESLSRRWHAQTFLVSPIDIGSLVQRTVGLAYVCPTFCRSLWSFFREKCCSIPIKRIAFINIPAKYTRIRAHFRWKKSRVLS